MLQLASLFSDGAVLQREMQIPVWGTAAPGTIVHAFCGKAEGYSRSSSTGKFTVYLPPQPAGGPFELKVSSGSESLVVRDILIGEVWIAGGQSNMAYLLNSDWVEVRPENGEELLARIQEREFVNSIQKPEMVRSICVPHKASGMVEDSFSGSWRKMTKSEAPGFSAVGAWFAKKVQETLHVPVGLIESHWGGTVAEAWTSRNGLMRNPDTAAILRESEKCFRNEDAWTIPYTAGALPPDFVEKNAVKDTGNKGLAKGWAEPGFDDGSWKEMLVPGSWIRQKITGNGAVWLRRTVMIPENWTGKQLLLHLDFVDKHDIAYFNGEEIGRTGKDLETDFWNTPRNYPVPAKFVRSGRAVVAIRAFSFMCDGSIAAGYLENTETGEIIPLTGVWKAAGESDHAVIAPVDIPERKFRTGNPNVPAMLFNSMIHPLIPYGIRGVIWYQGESNAGTMEKDDYYRKLHCLIDDWRFRWAQGDFPFIQMILAGYRKKASVGPGDPWPVLRDAQIRLSQDMPSVYAASAIDIGESSDIHPQNKKDAGLRMAQLALAKVYHVDGIMAAGPRLRKWSLEKNGIRLEFENAEGLSFRGGSPKGFFLADAGGRIFAPASVAIENDAVLLNYNSGMPYELYYSWADNPDGNLENRAGLPADPFRIQLHLFPEA